ncbi:MAG: Ran GTPase-activating protein (RanGAP) involved in mRNA processing and transport [Lentimonas sp.]
MKKIAANQNLSTLTEEEKEWQIDNFFKHPYCFSHLVGELFLSIVGELMADNQDLKTRWEDFCNRKLFEDVDAIDSLNKLLVRIKSYNENFLVDPIPQHSSYEELVVVVNAVIKELEENKIYPLTFLKRRELEEEISNNKTTAPELIEIPKAITNFKLINKKIGITEAQLINRILREVKSLDTLDIRDSYLENVTIAEVSKGLENNKTLSIINFSGCYIGVVGIHSIVNALKNNKTLIALSIPSNRIGDQGAQEIANIIKSNETLTTFYLGGNKIGHIGGRAIANALKDNKTVTIIEFGSNHDISPDILSEIKGYLRRNVRIPKKVLDKKDEQVSFSVEDQEEELSSKKGEQEEKSTPISQRRSSI